MVSLYAERHIEERPLSMVLTCKIGRKVSPVQQSMIRGGTLGTYECHFLKASTEFIPPKPNELQSAHSTFTFLATLGT